MKIEFDTSNMSEKEIIAKATDIIEKKYREKNGCPYYCEQERQHYPPEYEKGFCAALGRNPPKTEIKGYCSGQCETPECHCYGNTKKCECHEK